MNRKILEFLAQRLKSKAENFEVVAKNISEQSENHVFYEGFELLEEIKVYAEQAKGLLEELIQL
jgi:hypothetical protein